jgi:hypothetical protein
VRREQARQRPQDLGMVVNQQDSRFDGRGPV